MTLSFPRSGDPPCPTTHAAPRGRHPGDLDEAAPASPDGRSLELSASSGTVDLTEPAPPAAAGRVSDATLNAEEEPAATTPASDRTINVAEPAAQPRLPSGTVNLEQLLRSPSSRPRPAPMSACRPGRSIWVRRRPDRIARRLWGRRSISRAGPERPRPSDGTAFCPARARWRGRHALRPEDAGQANASDRTGEWTVNEPIAQQASHSSPTLDLPGDAAEAPQLRQPPPGKNLGSWAARATQRAPAPRPAGPGGIPSIAGYEILKELGRGAMGVVYKARQLGLNRMVALKMVLAGGARRGRGAAPLPDRGRGRRPVAAPQHRADLRGRRGRRPARTSRWSSSRAAAWRADRGRQAPAAARGGRGWCSSSPEAMDGAHRNGIVHRDLKPANILLTVRSRPAPQGSPAPATACIPKVTDFGLAKRLEDSGKTQAGAIMGTPSYMAPEQAEGRNDLVGPPADIYALGAILYDLLTGRPPFQGKTILDTLQQVHPASRCRRASSTRGCRTTSTRSA